MATLLQLSKSPRCVSCLRKLADSDLPRFTLPLQIFVRGKKKVRLPPTINVKLLKDVRGYGRKGSIVPVLPGRMRNIWFPQKRALYMTLPELKEAKDSIAERDYTFGMPLEAKETPDPENRPQVDATIHLLSPQRTQQILESKIPQYLEFSRAPIANQETSKTEALETADLEPATPQPVHIFGSVSTADIVASIRALLDLDHRKTRDEDTSRVVLHPEDVKILNTTDSAESDRIKTLGDFEFDIHIKGGSTIRRIVKVKAENS